MPELVKFPKVFVAGYNEVVTLDRNDKEVKSIQIICKDKVCKNPIMAAKYAGATMTGSIWATKGFTLEEVKKAAPLGSAVVGARWGAEIETQYGGVYEVEFPEEEEEVQEEGKE